MSSGISLEEKFDALMKSYQISASFNQDLKNENANLRHQIKQTKKQTKKVVKSPSDAIYRDDGELNSNVLSSSHEKKPHRRSSGGRRPSTNFEDLKLKFRN